MSLEIEGYENVNEAETGAQYNIYMIHIPRMFAIIRSFAKHLCNLARVDDDTERPVQILFDWHKYKLFLENVDTGRP